jgi:hypothetical protein
MPDQIVEVDEAAKAAAAVKAEVDAMNSAFAGVRSKKLGAEPVATPEPEPEPEPEAPPVVQDPYEKRIRSLEGTIGGLRSDLKKQRATVEALEAQRAAMPTQAQLTEAVGSESKMESLRKQFPDFAATLEEAMAGLSRSIDDRVMSKAAVAQAVEDGMSTAVELAELRIRYGSDPRKTTMQTPEFATWINSNPGARERMEAADTADEVLDVLGEFDATQGKKPAPKAEPKARAASRLDASIPATTGGGVGQRTPRALTEVELMNEGFFKVRPRR